MLIDRDSRSCISVSKYRFVICLDFSSGLTIENMMGFLNQALSHNSGEVRERAEKLIILLYNDVGQPVKNFLPPDDEKTRKNLLYKQMFTEFDKIDRKVNRPSDTKVCTDNL